MDFESLDNERISRHTCRIAERQKKAERLREDRILWEFAPLARKNGNLRGGPGAPPCIGRRAPDKRSREDVSLSFRDERRRKWQEEEQTGR
jgi:hypothetical protein